jgi:hypothetical protein
MKYSAGIKACLPFEIVFFTLSLVFNFLYEHTWEENLADIFKLSRVITGLIMIIGYGLYQAKTQKKV